MISGIEFYKKCKWNLCNRYPINFNINEIQENDLIFVNLDNIENFIGILHNNNLPKINIVTHNSDRTFTEDILLKIYHYVNKIYCINSICWDEKIIKIPLGFSDRLLSVMKNIDLDCRKHNLLYLNFFNSPHIKERNICYDYFYNKKWVTVGKYNPSNNIAQNTYYDELKISKYSLCPVGMGIDTHRFYESLYFSTIPIIIRNGLSDLHNNFPCVVVNKWDDIDDDYLEKIYNNKCKDFFKWKNKKQLEVDGWIK